MSPISRASTSSGEVTPSAGLVCCTSQGNVGKPLWFCRHKSFPVKRSPGIFKSAARRMRQFWILSVASCSARVTGKKYLMAGTVKHSLCLHKQNETSVAFFSLFSIYEVTWFFKEVISLGRTHDNTYRLLKNTVLTSEPPYCIVGASVTLVNASFFRSCLFVLSLAMFCLSTGRMWGKDAFQCVRATGINKLKQLFCINLYLESNKYKWITDILNRWSLWKHSGFLY